MKTLLASVGIGVAVGTGIFGAIDLLMRPNEKTWVNDKISHLWIWLSYQKSGDTLHVFLKKNIQKITRFMIYLIGVFSCLGWLGTILEEEAYGYQVATFTIVFGISMFITLKYLYPLMVKKLRETQNIWQYIRTTLIGTIASYLAASIISAAAIVPMMFFISEDDGDSLMLTATIFFALSPITALFMVAQTLLALALVWICIVYLLMGIYKVLAFFSLRIAESPKGAVAAMGGLLGAIGGILKAFMG